MKIKLHALVIIICLLFSNLISKSQILAWQFGTPASLGNEASYASTTTNPNIGVSNLTRGTLTATGLARAFSATNFTAGGNKANAIASNHYFQFTVNTNAGFETSLSSLDYKVRRSGTGPNAFIWQYSTNGSTFFDIGTDISYTLTTTEGDVQTSLILSSIPALQNVGNATTITFRLYAWGASATGGTFAIGRTTALTTTNSLALNGTINSIAPTLSATSLTFPNTCIGSNNILPTTITGSNLSGTSVLVGPFSSYGFSTNPLGPFDPSVTLSYIGNSLSSTVYAQYLPSLAGSNNGNIPMSGGGASGTIATTAQAFAVPSVTASSTPSPATVCAGSSVTLSGGGATTYTWSDGVNTQTDGVSFIPTTSSTYTVTGTTSGCSSTATLVVTVNPAPASPVITATPTSICPGGNSNLNAVSTGNTIRWYDAPTLGTLLTTVPSATNYNVAPGSTTTYYAEAVAPAGGTQTFSYTGSAQTFIVPAGVTSMDMECWGAQGGANWINNTNFGGYSKGTMAVTPGETLTIYVGNQPTTIAGGYNGGGAGDAAGRAGGGASDVRQGGTGLNNRIIVAGGGGGAGFWSSLHVVGGVGGGANLSGGDGYRNTIADPGGKGATVLAAGPDGTCSSFNNTNMAGAFGQGGSPATFGCGCEGYGGGGGWYGGAGSGNCRGGGGGSGYVIPSATNLVATSGVRIGDGQVILTWTGSGCAASNPRTPVTVTVNPIPTVTASSSPSPASVCAGSSVTLTGGGATTYTWSDGVNTQTDGISFIPAASSTYTVTGTSSGCSSTSTVVVTVNPAPASPIITATPTAICPGGNSDLNAVSTGNTINWYDALTAGTLLTTVPSATNYNVTPGSTTTYYAEAVSPAGGTQAFSYTGSVQTFTVPAGVTSINIDARGAQGGGSNGGAGGLGARMTGDFAVTPGQVLNIVVPQQGNLQLGGNASNSSGGGGGAFVYTTAPNTLLVAAGGGGGKCNWLSAAPLHPGAAGSIGLNGNASSDGAALGGVAGDGGQAGLWSGSPCAGGGTGWLTNGGGPFGGLGFATWAGGPGFCGGAGGGCGGVGGFGGGGGGGNHYGGGGGGGGYSGGGGGTDPTHGGGGGSFSSGTSQFNTAGFQTGNGQVILTWAVSGCASNPRTPVTVTVNPTPMVTASATPTTTCNNTVVTPTGGGASTYTWSGGLTDGAPFVASIGATSYTVTGTDGAGCTATSSVTVTGTAASGTLAPATSNQSQNQGDDLNASYYDPSCNLIATIDDGFGGNILGLTTATVNVDATAGVHNGQPFVRRWYQITPTNNGSADVILYINQADFNDYNAAVTAPYLPLPTSGNNADPNIANIRITKNADAGLGNSPMVIAPTTINWNGTYWELSFNTPSFSQFRVHSVNPGNIPLPATITNFSGRKLDNSDLLEWTTASEQNNAYFNLQHGTDGVNFTTIAKVNSQAPNGNSSSILNYSFENTKPQLGHNYYRLQQVDIDNQSTINAKVVDIIWGTNGSTVSIYPNPTQDVLNIDLYTSKVQNTTVKVLDMSGRVVKQIQARSEAGMSTLSVSLGELASGLYTVQVFDNNKLSHVSKVKKND